MANIPDNIVAILGVDNAGAITSIDPTLVFNKQVTTSTVSVPTATTATAQPSPTQNTVTNVIENTIALVIDAESGNIPMVNNSQDNLENSIVWQTAKKIGFNTKNPRWLIDANGGSINLFPALLTDGYKFKSINFAYGDFSVSGSEQIVLGDDLLLPIVNLNDLLIRGLIPVTATGKDRILFINDLGEVTAKTDIFLESLNGLTNKVQVFALGSSGTAPNVVSTVVSTVGTHTFNFPMAATAGVTAGLISKAQYDIFNAKEPAISFGTTSQYWRGDKSWRDFNTDARTAISLTTTGSGVATYNNTTGVLNIPTYTLTGVSAGGELSGTYPNPTLVNSAVITKVLTGYTVLSATPISSSDTILQAFGRVQAQLNALSGSLIYKGSWNASTNTPTIVSGTGTNGNYYIVSVAGTTTIDGISSWAVGDWIVFNSTTGTWQKIANQSVTSVSALTLGTTGTDLSSTVANSTSTPVITLNVPTASATNRGALSSTDWIRFNNKQDVIVNPITGTGTANKLAYFNSSSSITSWTRVTIDTSSPLITFDTNIEILGSSFGGNFNLTSNSTNSALIYFTNSSTLNDIIIGQQTSNDSLLIYSTSGLAFTEITQSGNLLNYGYIQALSYKIQGSATSYTISSATLNGFLTSTDWNRFNNKQDFIIAGTSSQYWRGDKSWQTLNTDAVIEGTTNKYFSNTAARLAISSAAIGLTYSSSTGVFSFTTGYSIPTIGQQTNWQVAYDNRISSFTTNNNSGAASFTGNALNIPNYTLAGLGGQAQLNGSGLVKVSGTTVTYLPLDTYYSSGNPSAYIALTALSATTPLSYDTTTDITKGVFSISQANTTTNGYLSSADWNSFNNKVPSTRTLTINGVTYDLTANRTWTIATGTVAGSGVANYAAKWINSNTLSTGAIYDTGTNVTIGNLPATSYRFNVANVSGTRFLSIWQPTIDTTDEVGLMAHKGGGLFDQSPLAVNASTIVLSNGLSTRLYINSTAVYVNGASGVSGGGALQVAGNVNITGNFQVNGVNIGGGGGGVSYLYQLSDVALIGTPSNGQALVYNSSTNKWYNSTISSGGGTVSSVFGRVGAVVANDGDYTLNLLGDVVITGTPSSGQVLQYNGSNWANASISTGGITSVFGRTTSAITAFDGDYSLNLLGDVVFLGTPSNGQVLQYNGTNWVNANVSTSGGVNYLYQLSDVNISGVADLQVLSYDLATNKWKNRAFTAAPVTSVFGRTGVISAVDGDYTLNLLGDVVITGIPSNGQILQYNGTSWINAAAPVTGITSVFGRTTSAITAVDGDYTLNLLGDVVITGTPSANQVLQYDGSKWINASISTTGVAGSGTINYIPKFSGTTSLSNSSIYEDSFTAFVTKAMNVTGQITASSTITATAFYESSDVRLKDLLTLDAVKDLTSLIPISYTFKSDEEQRIRFGYSAQEVRKLMKELCYENKDGYLSVSYTDIHTLKIKQLEDRVAELEKQLNLR